jgi:hypothetical protein
MADTKTSALTAATSFIGADYVPFIDSTGPTSKRMTMQTLHAEITNQSVSSTAGGFATDTYLTGSAIAIPSGAPYVGTTYKLRFSVTKTAVGTAAPIITVRIGTTGTVSDTSRCAFTFGAGTAAIDTGVFEVIATFRTVGATTTAVLQGMAFVTNAASTGIVGATGKAVATTSSGFDSTVAGSIIGASYNGGATAVHTVQLVRAELML